MIDLLIAAAMLQAPVNPCYAVGAAPPAGCPVWRSLHRDNQAELFAEPASLSPNGHRFRLRIRVLFAAAAGDGARTMVVDQDYDCRARTAALLDIRSYDQGGRELMNRTILRNAAQPRPVAAGAPEAIVLGAVCRG